MKRFCTIMLAVLITAAAVLDSASAAAVGSTFRNVSSRRSVSCCQYVKTAAATKTTSSAGFCYAPPGVTLEKSVSELREFFTRAKKIVDFCKSANADGFTKLYHPNSDLSINNAEILNGLPNDNSLCIMLFGNKMQDDGTMSAKFLARCKTALAMANKYPNALIMVTGGHTGGYKNPSEAATGKKWLVAHGVDADRIVTDELAWDTFSNILCTFTTSALSEHKEIRNFVVVSSDYHVPKCSTYLMTFIYTFGYDLPEEQGGRGYTYLGNLGAVLG